MVLMDDPKPVAPDTTDTGFRLGWYCFTRAMQLRMMRAPRPQVKPGDKV